MMPSEKTIDVLRSYLADPEVSVPARVYSAILLAIEFIEAKERAADLLEELT